jgi:hypothetical protein
MTLVILWRDADNIVVIADTLFRAGGRPGAEVGPKIFATPVCIRTFGDDGQRRICANVGFAFAGHTAAGQVTQALASAGLQNLAGGQSDSCPTIEQIAAYYARCAAYVVREFRRHHASDFYLFEGVVFGWQGGRAEAYSFEVKIDDHAMPCATVEWMDFSKFGLYAIGQGHEKIQAFIKQTYSEGRKSTPYEALYSVITDAAVPSVGGAIQAAVARMSGVELKPVLRVDPAGLAKGGFMGAEQSDLGMVGDYLPMSIEPIVLANGADRD